MASNEYTLSHQDVVKAVIIHQDIHEGFWTLNIQFDVAAGHAAQLPDPCLNVTIKGIGIMRASPSDPFAIDAAIVNPPGPQHVEGTVRIAAGVNGTQQGGMQFCRDVYRSVAVQSAAKAPTKRG
ncbi:hypothetical protein B0G80_7999 [Paraburkholderia sp. BL6669N2]|uniref:hypothetical protein n=1 Tax=unclassified Paraburkholderia TaxID=2615204 RepID=UPI000E232C09|nr:MULTISPECIES: hypothetical protein [unclassified Paraburkholderia]REG51500.1 hypothetical protein B0G80_7999 [Paraburkholderia sp. BL6669N2]TDY20576.1 hypothetical protein B0G81_0742 [Paraburkholderia sp. BL6665CI2N2]